MKEELSVSPKYTFIILSIFGLIAIIAISILICRTNRYNDELKILRTKSINGSIIELKDMGRGFCNLKIKEPSGIINQYSLSIVWEVKEYNIQVGDSISKEAAYPHTYQ